MQNSNAKQQTTKPILVTQQNKLILISICINQKKKNASRKSCVINWKINFIKFAAYSLHF